MEFNNDTRKQITIHRATIGDIAQIMQLIAGVVPAMNAAGNFQWDSAYPNVQAFENDIALKQLWVAEIDGIIAGVAAITTHQEPEYAGVGWNIAEKAIVTHRLAVGTQHRGMGIAAALLAEAEVEAVKRKIALLRIDTNTTNLATQSLFQKLGYRFAGEIGLAFRPALRFYCYEKRLR